jgi:hypothetical protein
MPNQENRYNSSVGTHTMIPGAKAPSSHSNMLSISHDEKKVKNTKIHCQLQLNASYDAAKTSELMNGVFTIH